MANYREKTKKKKKRMDLNIQILRKNGVEFQRNIQTKMPLPLINVQNGRALELEFIMLP